MNDPIGLRGSPIPALERIIASDTFSTASSCPITLLCNNSGKCKIFSLSLSINFVTGIPVHLEIIFVISSSVTLFLNRPSSFPFSDNSSSAFNSFCNSGSLPYLSSATFPKSYSLSACSICAFTCSISSRNFCTLEIACFSFSHFAFIPSNFVFNSAFSFLMSSNLFLEISSVSFERAVSSISNCIIFLDTSSSSVGIDCISVFIIAQASSIKSIALSGKNLSEIYLCDNVAAVINALSDILTP